VDFSHGALLFALAVLAATLLSLLAVLLGILPDGRIDLRRTVLVRAPTGPVWSVVSNLPALHGAHGRMGDFCRITGWSLRHGDGLGAGSVWRASGVWGSAPYWADIEILRAERGRTIAFRMRRDSLGTERGLRHHSGSLSLAPIDAGATKVTWHLSARLRGPRLVAARYVAPQRLRALLLDQGLRSLKVEIEGLTAGAASRHAAPLDPPADDRRIAPPPRLPPETTL